MTSTLGATSVEDFLASAPMDPLHRSRAVMERLAAGESDIGAALALAAELRRTGRADLALRAIARAEETLGPVTEVLYERASALQSLGYLDDARAVLARLPAEARKQVRVIALELKIARKSGDDGPKNVDHAALAGHIQTKADLAALEDALPVASMTYGAFRAIRAAARKLDPQVAARLTRRYVKARARSGVARIASSVVLGLARVAAGGRRPHIASMGKFTRLADLVDRVDPQLRALQADGGDKRNRLFVLFFGGYPNRQLFDMYGRHCTIVPATNRVTRRLGLLAMDALRVAGRSTEITTDYRVIGPPSLAHPAVLSFKDDEHRKLRRGLANLGIDSEKPFVVFGLRDMAYYEFYGNVMNIPLEQQGRRSSTHHRCPPLASYVKAAEYWAARGHQVVRMGLRVSEKLPAGLDPRIVDYASLERTDELDAYLFARCWFMIAGDTGLFSGSAAFDRPSVLSDLHLVQNTMYSTSRTTKNIFVPKLIRDKASGQLISFREHIYFNHTFAYFEDCESAGVAVVHNEPEDIIAASEELAERLEGRHVETAEARELQKAYHAIYPPDFIGYRSTGLVSSAFLKKYSHLL